MQNFQNAVDFFKQLIQGNVSYLLITVIVITILLASLTSVAVKSAGNSDVSLVAFFFKSLGGELIGAIIFIYFFTALITFIAKIPFLNLHSTNPLILGQEAMIFVITLEILIIPSLVLAIADSVFKTISISIINFILASLIFYVLITLASFKNVLNMPLLILVLIFITGFASYTGFVLIDEMEKSKKKTENE